MRKHFVDSILKLLSKDKDLIFLTADLGFGSFEVIAEKFPNQFYNVGIAEQNMVGVACGLGLQGKKVIIYSIANFTTLRVLEQIRNYLIYHDCRVLIVNGGGGFSYGSLGYTHHAVEDISILRSLPQIKIYAPFNQRTIELSIDSWYKNAKVAYLRLEKAAIDDPNELVYDSFGVVVGDIKSNNFIIGYGTVIEEAIKAREILLKQNINTTIIVLYDLKQSFSKIYTLLDEASKLLFIEENSANGGVGEGFITSCIINDIKVSQVGHLGVNDFISNTIGDQIYLRDIHGLSASKMVSFFKS